MNRLVWMDDFNIFQQAIDDSMVDVMGNGPLMTRPYREWYQIGGLTAFPPGPVRVKGEVGEVRGICAHQTQ